MTDDRWQELIETAKGHFKNVSLKTEDLLRETAEGEEKEGTQDILEFANPAGHFRVIRENRPLILEKKQFFSHRMGDTARTEYKKSQTEFTHKIRVFKELDFDEWVEITLDKLGL